MSAAESIEEAIEKLHAAKLSNDKLQSQYVVGSPEWRMCEATDDRIFDALALLGV